MIRFSETREDSMLGPLRVPPFTCCHPVFQKVTECWRSNPSFMLETLPSAVWNVAAPSPPPRIQIRPTEPTQQLLLMLGRPSFCLRGPECASLHTRHPTWQNGSDRRVVVPLKFLCLTELAVCLLWTFPWTELFIRAHAGEQHHGWSVPGSGGPRGAQWYPVLF